ncbi:MAG: D-3-phosphoglycerate dehydrogenase [Alphaproteobacteria bacterium MarineAlpha4_Bin2]|nr:MAG: D-3-phosphoglycerate dehydrogenase [Alphaproteobacteria bacterium MarineAlpha4_Bin2]
MLINRFPMFYFNRMQHRVAQEILEDSEAFDIRFLNTDMAESETWPAIETSLGYQIGSARDELPERYHVTAKMLRKAPKLLAVCTHGAGYDTVDVDACTEAGVIVCNQAGQNREAVAEHALGMMISLGKKIYEADRRMRGDRDWDRNQFMGQDIMGKTVGIVGLGHIGSRMAELCGQLFQMRVLSYDPYLTPADFKERGAEPVSLDELLRESDYVTVHTPRNEETRNMFGVREFGLMKGTAYFVITARGGIIDEAALAMALQTGEIAAAGIDVFAVEPPPLDDPLVALDNVILTPHTAGVTVDARISCARGAAEQWLALASGRRPERIVNPDAWPVFTTRFAELVGKSIVQSRG